MTDSFGPDASGDDLVDAAGEQALYFFLIGVGSFILSWVNSYKHFIILFRLHKNMLKN